jgi:hypothetical protein
MELPLLLAHSIPNVALSQAEQLMLLMGQSADDPAIANRLWNISS